MGKRSAARLRKRAYSIATLSRHFRDSDGQFRGDSHMTDYVTHCCTRAPAEPQRHISTRKSGLRVEMWRWGSAGARVFRLFLQCTLPHPHHAVDLAPLLHLQPPRREVSVNDARRLNLDPLLRAHPAAHFAANDGFLRDDVPLYFAALRDEHLAAGAHRADDRSFDLHDPFGDDIALHTHACPDDREPGFGLRRAVPLLGDDRHVRSPVSRRWEGPATVRHAG